MRLRRGISSRGRVALRPRTFGLLGHRYVLIVIVSRAREAFCAMKRQQPEGGRIINNGSVSAQVPRPHAVAYTATKHAITGLTKAISLEGRAHSIACGQIDIGNAATELTSAFGKGALQANGSILAEPRIDLRHVSDAVLYMAGLPLDANVQFMTLMATNMPLIGRG